MSIYKKKNETTALTKSKYNGYTNLNRLSNAELAEFGCEVALGQAEVAVLRDNLRAVMTRNALSNASGLAKLEESCKEIAPEGAEDYRLITKAYAYAAARMILGQKQP